MMGHRGIGQVHSVEAEGRGLGVHDQWGRAIRISRCPPDAMYAPDSNTEPVCRTV
jgi:hypothetical protein